jgi:hypothetical protein
VDPRAGLDDLEKRKHLIHRDTNSDTSVVQSVASRYTDYALPAPEIELVFCVYTVYICIGLKMFFAIRNEVY